MPVVETLSSTPDDVVQDPYSKLRKKKQLPPPTELDPFDKFIHAPQTDDDAIKFWTGHEVSIHADVVLPINALARMALDFLAAAATSTGVERLFSHSGLVVGKRRYNLSPNSIRESTVLGNWLSHEGLVPIDAIARHLNQKKSRKREPDTASEWSDTDEEEDSEIEGDEAIETELVIVSDDEVEEEKEDAGMQVDGDAQADEEEEEEEQEEQEDQQMDVEDDDDQYETVTVRRRKTTTRSPSPMSE